MAEDDEADNRIVDLTTKRPRRRLRAFDKIRALTRPSYWVKGIIPRNGLVVVWGPPKCGKSFWTFDLVMHIALGWSYRGHRVQRGLVCYCALEGGEGFANRIDAWRTRHLTEDHDLVPFFLLDEPLDLAKQVDQLIADIRAQLTEAPGLVVIDTLNRAMTGDENSSEDMSKMIQAFDRIRAALNCTVIVIHHCGVGGARPRGHTSLTGACDAQIAVDRAEDGGLITAKVEHLKDGELSQPMSCRLELMDLGLDDEGDPLTSCIVVPDTSGLFVKPPPKLTPAAKLALEQLRELPIDPLNRLPRPNNDRVPPGVHLISQDKWRAAFFERYPSISEQAGTKRDTTKKAFLRAAERLQEAMIIGIWNDLVWLSGQRDMPGQ